MTIGELKEIIKNLPDDMLVGGSGHYGEYLECYDICVENVRNNYFTHKEEDSKTILCISLEDAGECPD